MDVFKIKSWEFPWCSTGNFCSLRRGWVQSLVRELVIHRPLLAYKKEKKVLHMPKLNWHVLQFNSYSTGHMVNLQPIESISASLDQSREMKYQSLMSIAKRFQGSSKNLFEELTGEKKPTSSKSQGAIETTEKLKANWAKGQHFLHFVKSLTLSKPLSLSPSQERMAAEQKLVET